MGSSDSRRMVSSMLIPCLAYLHSLLAVAITVAVAVSADGCPRRGDARLEYEDGGRLSALVELSSCWYFVSVPSARWSGIGSVIPLWGRGLVILKATTGHFLSGSERCVFGRTLVGGMCKSMRGGRRRITAANVLRFRTWGPGLLLFGHGNEGIRCEVAIGSVISRA